MDEKILEDFFNDRTSQSQTSKVLDWFKTPEGQNYLKSRLDDDFHLMDSSLNRNLIPEFDSDKLYKSIQPYLRSRKYSNTFELRGGDWLAPAVKVAATVLVVLTASIFTIIQEQNTSEQILEKDPVVFQTNEKQTSEITLNDGTTVFLNSDSELILSKDFLQGKREVTLTGEAYFDVTHNQEQPFLVNTNHSTVEVLGTAFNVQSRLGKDNVQVAVLEGTVSFTSSTEGEAVVLSQGLFGYLDSKKGSIKVDEIAVDNYLVWKSGELKFDDLSLDKVCTQLYRLYEVECNYQNERIKNLPLTANFSNESIEKTLTVISLSLNIEFIQDGEKVIWKEN